MMNEAVKKCNQDYYLEDRKEAWINVNIASLLIPKSKVAYLYDNMTVRQGLAKMKVHEYTMIPVLTKEGIYVESISEGDFLWCIINNEIYTPKSQEDKYIYQLIDKKRRVVPAVKITAPIEKLLSLITEQNYVPVVDDRGIFVGIVTRKDIIKQFCKNRTI